MDSHTLLWLTTLVLTAGGLLILLTGKRRTPSEELHTVLHGIVPLIAACSYFAMANGQGAIILGADAAAVGTGAGRIFYFARYIDWTFTTPLLLVTLSMTAMHAGQKRPGAIAGVVLADVMMILTAFFFGISEVAWIKWTWFIVSCAAFLGVFYVIWVSQMQANALERDDVRTSYRRNATILTVLWLIYPVILAVAPDGLSYIGDTLSVLLIGVLDVVSKVVYGLMTVASDAKTTERDLAEGGRAASLRRAA
jgi:bacteriorhodopsin